MYTILVLTHSILHKFDRIIDLYAVCLTSGLNVKFAYGWVDLESPSGVPYEVVVGIRRDPLMMVCLQVQDMKANEAFFTSQLGMKPIPFPLARAPTSEFEAKPPPKSVHLGYGDVGMSILLIQAPKKVQVTTGNVLDQFTIVYDDSSILINPSTSNTSTSTSTSSTTNDSSSTVYSESFIRTISDPSTRTILSPDGYKFRLRPYSEYAKSIA